MENVCFEFVINVFYELKIFVMVFKGFVEILFDGVMYDEVLLKKFLMIIKEESDWLYCLIMDIFVFFRIE